MKVCLLLLLLVPAVVLAQEPGFSDLPSAQGETETQALVRALLRRITELERRVDALEAAGAVKLTGEATGPVADPEAQRLLVAANEAKAKLSAHLDGHTYALRGDERAVHARAHRSHAWATVEADAKAFTKALEAAVARASGLKPESKPTLQALVRFARGRTVYQVRGVAGLGTQQVALAPVDFATDVVPVEEKK